MNLPKSFSICQLGMQISLNMNSKIEIDTLDSVDGQNFASGDILIGFSERTLKAPVSLKFTNKVDECDFNRYENISGCSQYHLKRKQSFKPSISWRWMALRIGKL